MGLSYNEFWNSTPRSFQNRQRGYLKKKQEDDRLKWELARYTSYNSMIVHISKKHQAPLHKLLPFPWDETKELRKITKQDTNKLIEKWLAT